MYMYTHLKKYLYYTCTYPHMNHLVNIIPVCDLVSTDFWPAKGNLKKPYHGPRMTVAMHVIMVHVCMNTQAHTPLVHLHM